MSLIIKFGDVIYLMSKGADSIILPRILFKTAKQQNERIDIMKSLLDFAKEGLRTLVVA